MRWPFLFLALGLAACTAPATELMPADEHEAREPSTSAARPFVGPGAFRSNGGSWLLELTPGPASMPDNESFRFEVRVADARSGAAAADVALAVDAAMPEHGHGMNRVPRVSQLGAGHFLVEGMYFHMTGRWELYLDIRRGALTERAQCRVELADE
jgi:hypothetical protein